MKKKDGQAEYEWTGLLDFGDAHKSCVIFDLAIIMAYMMLDTKLTPSIDVGGHCLAGYVTHQKLSKAEFDALLVRFLKMSYLVCRILVYIFQKKMVFGSDFQTNYTSEANMLCS